MAPKIKDVQVGFIPGDGIGQDVAPVSREVLDRAVARAYGGRRRICWRHLAAGEEAMRSDGEVLPRATVEAIREMGAALKGPLGTPVASGHRSANVFLRQALGLYACIRPVRWFPGLPSPLRHPEGIDLVIFRENTEDVYIGAEWAAGTAEARKLLQFLSCLGADLDSSSGVAVKPISKKATVKLVRRALDYALAHGRRRVTLVHKGNIMKFTEGAFCEWGYHLAESEYGGRVTVSGQEAETGLVLLDDRIADNMFQQLILSPGKYDVLVAPNLNGDYLSDAAAALVGGLGIAPGANLSDSVGVFEPTHGTAPDIAGRGSANPASMILSGAMLLDHLGWEEAASLVRSAVERTIGDGCVTADLLARGSDSGPMSTEEFGSAVAHNLD